MRNERSENVEKPRRRKVRRRPNRSTRKSARVTKRKEFISADGQFMNEVAAAKIVGLSISRLQNLRVLKKGPPFIKRGGRVYYMRDDLYEYMVNGIDYEMKYGTDGNHNFGVVVSCPRVISKLVQNFGHLRN